MLNYFLKPIKKFRQCYLSGIVTGGADEDPSSISTYSIIGATTGFSQLWLLLVSTPLLISIQRVSARIGDVTKKGIITLIKENHGRKIAFLCVVALAIANLVTLGADIIGMASGFQLLTGKNYLYFIIPVIILIWYIVVFDNYKHITRYFFWFSAILLTYVISAFLIKPDWLAILKALFLPHFQLNSGYVVGALALFGTTFSPYAFFWQTEEEIEEHRNADCIKKTNKAILFGFVFSNLISFFIMVASAGVILDNNIELLTVKEIAQALAPVAGSWAPKLFGLGLVGSGILAIPILASSCAYAIAEFFKWPEGLNKKPSRAKGFYGVITFSFLLCLLILIFRFNPIKIIFFSQVIVGIITPFLIYFLLRLVRNKKIMGDCRADRLSLLLGWVTITILVASDILLFYYLF